MPTLGEKILLHQKQMQEVREFYEDRDYEVARFVNPRRELLKDSQRFDDKGEARGRQAWSGIPNSALNIWADGMQGHMVSQSLRWFKSMLSIPRLNEIDEVQRYLQQYDEAMYGEFNGSNFYAVLGEWFRDAGSVGTATLYTEEDIANKSAVHTPIHLREILISEDKFGNVDTVHRKFFLTARQAVDKFGVEKLHPTIVKNAEEHPETKHEFIHAVFPNTERMYGSLLAENKPIASVYLQKEGKPGVEDSLVVKKSGYDINPYAVWRLRKNSDEIYGYSPAHDAMVSIKGLNQMEKTLLGAAQLHVEPAMNVPEAMRGRTQIRPRGKNYFEKGGDTISTISNQGNFPIGIDREERMQRVIEDKYRVEFFMILSRAEREMTATEIMERQSEKAVLLGPQVDRLIKEGLEKTFDVVSDIAEKAGRLPEPPQILIDTIEEIKAEGNRAAKIDIRFTGPLAQAQDRLFKMQPIKNGLNELAQASVLYPEVLDKVDPERLAERILDTTNFPQDVMRTDTELKAFQDARAAAQAQAQAQEQAAQMAESYPKINKAAEAGSPAEAIGEQL